ncbi:deoxyribodipyrimidine photolyase [Paraburkholderia bryophila]|uniref:FAD-binding domain-containing protein n=1 Tax=Paraburkholderia bryophila TaxID=420952 RepID=UPI00234BDDBD|nr:FAD-binding domain-containing protein [Paraburkholderia bryophila]WCM18288.1 deoxyribodipyrimidine photolyase [Paraburkholderia bryophila]
MSRWHKPEASDGILITDDPVPDGDLGAPAPTLAAARARIAAVQPTAYARTRNALDGAVTGLSPYITHGFITLPEVVAGVSARRTLDVQHKFIYELGWREFFHHVWHLQGEAIFESIHEGPLPEHVYAKELPADIRQGNTGVPVVDMAVRELYATGTLHNHARMWLASYVVHQRKVHWRAGADWLYAHLLDGDLASNHLSWQWVAGTGSSKPYVFNAENVARYAPPAWHSPGSVIDTSYESLDRIARGVDSPALTQRDIVDQRRIFEEPRLLSVPPDELGASAPESTTVAGRDVWLVHPWSLGELPVDLPAETVVIGLFLSDFHQVWPWNERRWRFVGTRMREITELCWIADSVSVRHALGGAKQVRSVSNPHLAPYLEQWAKCTSARPLFPAVDELHPSFSKWWARASRDLHTTADLLAYNAMLPQ